MVDLCLKGYYHIDNFILSITNELAKKFDNYLKYCLLHSNFLHISRFSMQLSLASMFESDFRFDVVTDLDFDFKVSR